VSVSLVDNSGDLVIGGRLYIAPSRGGSLDQINSPLALSAGLANELVARITQDASCIGRSAFEGHRQVGSSSGRAAMHQASGQSFDARAGRSAHD
jgi:hypothetical protein